MKRTLLLIILFIGFLSTPEAQILEPVKWSYEKKQLDDNKYELSFTATIDNHWHLYSQNVPEGGPEKTSFYFYDLGGFELADKTIKIIEEESYVEEGDIDYIIPFTEPDGLEENDPNFGMIVKYFEHEAKFTREIMLTTQEPLRITGYIYFMCCDDSKCLPPAEIEFEFLFNGAKAGETTAVGKEQQGSLIDVETLDIQGETVSLDDSSEETTIGSEEETGVVVVSMWDVIIEAILWGFVALFTPCVFPMIPMTITFFMKGGQNKRRGRIQAAAYGSSIVLLYTVPIAVIILITYFVGGKTVTADIFNWLATHWIPNILFFLIFMIFAASFLGMFEIVLPSWMVSKADSKADSGGLAGAFFMAVTLVLVSFSCTGPLVGSVLVKSAQGEIFEPIFAMLAFSIAFALPFTLFAFFPSWLQRLPKSGGWLNSVKVVLGFIEIALGLKFLSVADQTYHWGILDREVYLALWIVTFSLLGLYLLGKLKFRHDSEMSYLPVPRLGLAIIALSFVVYLIPGMWGAPLKALSGYLPPQQTHDFDINAIIRQNAQMISASGGSRDDIFEICEKPKFGDFLHLPHGLEGYFDYEQALACAKKVNKPIFIDFTGHGCVNCREMEANVWSDPRVLKRLREDYIVTALYVDDKTKLPESEWVVSDYDGKTKKSVGKKYADFQISHFNVNAQPYYVLLDHEGRLLNKPRAYDLDVDEFVEFLDTGLENYKNGKHL
ncbi:MAG: thioredoxin family protein [Bacteroidetes bacterium]|nr:thioredoxin family protein [Bacteroidota bacterium]